MLQAIADGYQYGFDIIDQTGLPSGTVYPALGRLERDGFVKSAWEDEDDAHAEGPPGTPLLQADGAGREGARGGRVVLSVAACRRETPRDGARVIMLRWCDLVLRAAAPIVPHDIRRDWLREWRAEFAFTAARAARLDKPMPISSLTRAVGAVAHAAWLRWDRWRIEMIWQDLKHALRALQASRASPR